MQIKIIKTPYMVRGGMGDAVSFDKFEEMCKEELSNRMNPMGCPFVVDRYICQAFIFYDGLPDLLKGVKVPEDMKIKVKEFVQDMDEASEPKRRGRPKAVKV